MMAKKLLVADDSVTIQKVIRLALSNEGYEIQAVSDGNDAIQQIAVFRPTIVLIDVSLPGKSAFEVKRAINAHSDLKDVRFVLMSSAFEKVDEAQAGEVHFHARLTKPFDPAHLREILIQVVANESQAPDSPSPTATSILTIEPTVPNSTKALEQHAFHESPPSPPSTSGTDRDKADLPPQSGTHAGSPSAATPAASPASRGASPGSSSEDDIRRLTDFTISISGMDSALKSPENFPNPFSEQLELPPVPPLSSGNGSGPGPSQDDIQSGNSENPSSSAEDFGWSVEEPTIRPLPSFLKEERPSTFPLEGLSAGANAYRAASDEPVFADFLPSPGTKSSAPPPPAFSPSRHLPPGAPPLPETSPEMDSYFSYQASADGDIMPVSAEATAISEKEIELLVSGKVEDALRKMTQATLPGIIEKIVKEEIHRLLSEQP